MKKTRYNRKFTLIEMLIVVGIASLLFALLGPAFTRMTQSNAVEQHASGLKLGMERARALAVSQRRYVAMLLPSKSVSDATINKFHHGGYRLAYVTQENPDSTEGDKDKNSFFLDSWIPDNEWTNNGKSNAFLLEICIEDNPKNVKEDSDVLSATLADKIYEGEKLLSSTKISSSVTLPSLVFSPYGDILGGSDHVELYFYVCGQVVHDRLKLRLNKLSGKVEFIE